MPRFLALFMGSPDPNAAPPPPSDATVQKGIAAWGAWMEKHAARIVDSGGPLGKTKRASSAGVADIRNAVAGFVIVEAASHEAAAALFEQHPHFTIFPGESVEIMPCLPIPGR